MCLLLFYINPAAKSNEFYLILVNVRDEVYNRPTKAANFWEKYPNIIGGMDIEPGKEGGTWFAMNKEGKIGALLNILQPDNEILPNKKGRGFLAVDYLTGNTDNLNYCHNISLEKDNYNGFLLVTIDLKPMNNPKIVYFTNASLSPPKILEPGIHCFGNSITPETPWPKVTKAKEKFTEIVCRHNLIDKKNVLVDNLFLLLLDGTICKLDENMLKQGTSKLSYLEKLSSIFVCIPEVNYGSRCHTIVLMDGAGNVDYFEKSRDESAAETTSSEWTLTHHSFKLEI